MGGTGGMSATTTMSEHSGAGRAASTETQGGHTWRTRSSAQFGR